jgi:dienelactone hydrolase
MTAALTFAQSPEEKSRLALEMVLAGKYEAFYAQFSPEMKKAIALPAYASQVDQLMKSLGRPQSQDPPQTRNIADAVTVTIPLHWPGATLNFIVSWNAAGQIQGTWFHTPEPPAAAPYQTPPYSRPDSFRSSEAALGADASKLPGTLTVPKGEGPWPAVVLVHGSGPNDRDESVGGVKVFRDLAEGLATRGIAVLRYDKRTKIYPQSAAGPEFTMTRETVDDAILAAAWLRKQDGIDPRRIFILGHSQGGYMMPRMMKADPTLAGVIIMAGSVRTLEELVVEQAEYMASLQGETTPAQQASLAAIRRDPWIIFPGASENYKADLKCYDPVSLAAASPLPMLILQGERDYQVRMTDFNLWKAGLARKKNATTRSYPKLNHLFVAGEGRSVPGEYAKPGHVSAETIADIADWIRGR